MAVALLVPLTPLVHFTAIRQNARIGESRADYVNWQLNH